MKMMEYKGYIGTIEADFEQDMLFGKLAYIRDVVTYEAHTVADLQKAFEESVDEYLSSCAELHKKPDKPFKGSFNVRIGEELHRQASLAALLYWYGFFGQSKRSIDLTRLIILLIKFHRSQIL
ncbi:type II toxin-antitoxin system HicB family antitoxin [Pelistega europaea]|uniref:Type II toxin-antitoxin system HicB family antitoxin n=1 Tax=Pelistega europaea TaxID=106147 RepID=A0A7Y4P6W6_9BURK|nr:type II toxin-antitoxin system HicB family antitoxin [Pelistega europaea]NOL50145.1 type II toxin-antitoxin system HicB family antitoxin [Pelistega europaea]